jgi:hypothetical protein
MNRSITLAALAALMLVAPVAHGREAALKVTLAAPGHSPQIGKRWPYAVHATSGGKPVAGRITAQIVDPLGGTHPVEFGTSKKLIVKRPFTGVFRDFVIWPASSRGIPLKFRVIVTAAGARKVIDYAVTPRS